jgi:hypothetical protein
MNRHQPAIDGLDHAVPPPPNNAGRRLEVGSPRQILKRFAEWHSLSFSRSAGMARWDVSQPQIGCPAKFSSQDPSAPRLLHGPANYLPIWLALRFEPAIMTPTENWACAKVPVSVQSAIGIILKELNMKTRISAIAVVLMALLAVHGWAADEKADTAGKCPVSAKPASMDHAADFDGGKVYFCCDNCPAEFAKDSAKFAAKAHLQMDVTGQLTQTACPFTGKPINAEQTAEVGGVKVAFCCGNCKKAAVAMEQDKLIDKVFADISKSFKVAAAK